MRSKHFHLLCAVTIVLLVSMACNLSVPGNSPTATAQVTAQDVPTATEQQLPTESPKGTMTATLEPTEAATATPTLTLEPSLTPTIALPVAKVIKEANCRVGPGGMYDLVLILKAGDTVEVVARDLGGGFVFVKNQTISASAEGCWMLQTSLTVSGNLTPLPAFTPPPSPTLALNFTVSYKGVDSCHGFPFVRFIVVNTGGVKLNSAYVKVTNLKTKESTEQSVNNFGLTAGCDFINDITPLGMGQTGYLQSDVFKKGSPKGQKLSAVFQVCTEQNLKGLCMTQTLQVIAK
jgi:hypothetical protein